MPSSNSYRRIFLATLGFDTKFQMRTLINIGKNMIDHIIIVLPKNNDERALRALSDIRRLAVDIMGINTENLEVEVSDPINAVSSIYWRLRKYEPSVIIADLSGGMRALILETMIALLILHRHIRVDIKINVWTEDMKNQINLSPALTETPILDDLSIMILQQMLMIPLTLQELKNMLKKPKTTIYQRLRALAEQGLINVNKKGRNVYYQINERGKLALLINKVIK